jgi:hypothetical protein
MRTISTMMAGILLSATISPLAATAADRNPIKGREHNQQVRIRQGIQSGELTRREAVRLEREETRIRVNDRFARADGKLTPAERRRLQRELRAVSRDIYKQKHDGQDRN